MNTARLSGPRKAAMLMVVLGEDAATTVYKNLEPAEVEAITEELAVMDRISPELALELLEEYYRQAVTQEYLSHGGLDYASRLLIIAVEEDTWRDLLEQKKHTQEMCASKLDSLQN